MRVLITGGNGFIGSHLAERCILEGWHVTVVDRESRSVGNWMDRLLDKQEFVFIHSDMIEQQVLNSIKSQAYDVIFHQAAVPRVSYSVEHPWETTDENINKTVKLLEAANGNCKRFIFASSSSVYGGADELPTKETCPLNPKSPYALQKKVGEEFCRLFGELYNMDTVCLRYFNVFGPRQLGDSPYSTAISAWCHAIKNRQSLRKDGTGEQSRDMCYVDNVVEANILAARYKDRFTGEAFNVACDDQVSNNAILSEFMTRFPDISIKNAPFRVGDVMHTRASIDRARVVFGYNPKVYFWDGFKRTLDWWELQKS